MSNALTEAFKKEIALRMGKAGNGWRNASANCPKPNPGGGAAAETYFPFMRYKDIGTFLASVALPEAVGGIAGLATMQGVREWYPALRKPSFNPPSWVFGPVWTALYFLMGISLYLAWRSPRGPARSRALLAFAVQLALNAAWSFLFFAFRRTGWALLEIALLWIAIAWMILAMRKTSPAAAWLQAPYLAWVSYASALNAALWRLNSSS